MQKNASEERKLFKKSMSLKKLMSRASQEPISIFENYPILEVRRECLKEMSKERNIWSIHSGLADWAEQAINDLIEQHDEIANDLMLWYLFRAENENIVVRALEFVISLKKKNSIAYDYGKTSKLIAGRIKKDASLFECKYLDPLADFLKDYIREIFHEFKEEGQREMGYLDDIWHSVERMLRTLILVGDFSLLSDIEDIIVLFQEKKINPADHEPVYVRDMHLAMLKSTKKFLNKAKREFVANRE